MHARLLLLLSLFFLGGCCRTVTYQDAASDNVDLGDGTQGDTVADTRPFDGVSHGERADLFPYDFLYDVLADANPIHIDARVDSSADTQPMDSSCDQEPADLSEDTTGDAPPADTTVDAPTVWQLLFVLHTTSVKPRTFGPKAEKSGDLLQWRLGDGTVIDGNTVSHRFDNPGEKTVQVFSRDGATGITSVDAVDTDLTGSIPGELGQLSNLTSLNLTTNNFTGSVPHELGQLSNLDFLDLSLNALTGSIPSELNQLSKLAGISFSTNQLTSYEAGAFSGLKDIAIIDVSHNQLDQAAIDAIVNDIYQDRELHTHVGIKLLLLNAEGGLGSNAAPSATACGQIALLQANHGWLIGCYCFV